MIVYLETSAAAKILFREAETAELTRQLDHMVADDVPLISSIVLETELRRAAVREGASQALVTDILDRFDLIELDRSIFRAAGLLPGRNLRSLDALHIAAALAASTDVMISYDQRQIDAAVAAGLRTLSPR